MGCLDENTVAAYFDLRLSPVEVERLFAHVDGCAACGRLVMAAAQTHQLGDATEHDAVERDPPAPRLGRYRIERVLGVGGMGVVYLARDPELDRRVAIKLLRPDPRVPAETLRARLTREAQATARLSHRNVVAVHEIGSHGDQVFVVMELVEGATLTRWLRERPRGWREIVRVFVAAGTGLEAAHRAGIVHRDFKPDNVLVSHDGRVCVTDFGLARIEAAPGESAARGDAVTTTSRGGVIGTPAYMAPEQLAGEPTDARSDVFSFCVALHEALYGVRPYTGDTLDALRTALAAGRLERPRRLIGPRAHRAAILRGLAIDPAARPPSMAALLAVLRVDPAVRRNRMLAGGLAVAAGAVAAVAGLAIRGAERPACADGPARLAGVWDAPRKAQVQRAFAATAVPYADAAWRTVEHQLDGYAARWSVLRTEACAATDRSDALRDRTLACLDDRLDELRTEVEVFAAADPGAMRAAAGASYALSELAACQDTRALLDEVPPPPQAQAAEVAALRRQLSRAMALDAAGRYDDVDRVTPEIVRDAQRLGYGAGEAGAVFLAGLAERRRRNLDVAIATLHRAAALAERAHDARLVAKSWRAIVTALQILGRREDGLLWADYAEAAAVRAGDGPVDVARIAANRALLLADAGRRDDALAETQRVLALLAGAAERDTPQVHAARGNAASVLHLLGRGDEALQQHRAVLAFFEQAFGRDNPDTLIALNNVISDLVDLGRFAEALPLAEQLVARQDRAVGPEHRSMALALATLAGAEYGAGRFAPAREHIVRALALYDKNAIGGAAVVIALAQLGEIEHALDRPDAAATALGRSVALGERTGVSALMLAEPRFELAKLEPDPARATGLATQARDGYAAAGMTRERDQVAAWLAGRAR
jgi:tetratricopeptide (TPR) repeat protein/predicted Ser/Thr protein kinase